MSLRLKFQYPLFQRDVKREGELKVVQPIYRHGIIAIYITVAWVAIMKFYNRENELLTLHNVSTSSNETAQMTFIVGRRRVGKTKLILAAYPNNIVYFLFQKNLNACYVVNSKHKFNPTSVLPFTVTLHNFLNCLNTSLSYPRDTLSH